MSRWKKLDNWEESLLNMTVEQLEAELVFWKRRVQFFVPKVQKLALKQVYKVESALNKRRAEQDDNQL